MRIMPFKTAINFFAILSLVLVSFQATAQSQTHVDDFESLLSSARQGDMDAQARLAELYPCKDSIGHNESSSYNGQGSLDISEPRMRYLDSVIKIGEMYVDLFKISYGFGNEIGNLNRAYGCTARASELGSAIAQAFWADIYAKGMPTFPRSAAESLRLARLSASKGNADGQYWVASAYFNGVAVPQDYNEALKWFRLAAEQGHEAAQTMLGAFR